MGKAVAVGDGATVDTYVGVFVAPGVLVGVAVGDAVLVAVALGSLVAVGGGWVAVDVGGA